jgi:hypothetical protein
LLPCPFCGSPAMFDAVPRVDGEPNAGGEYIECTGVACKVTTRLMFPVHDSVKPLLAEVWNRRALQNPTEQGQEVVSVPREMLKRAETMLRTHAQWYDGVDKVGAGHDEDTVLVSLPNQVRIVDMADDIKEALK